MQPAIPWPSRSQTDSETISWSSPAGPVHQGQRAVEERRVALAEPGVSLGDPLEAPRRVPGAPRRRLEQRLRARRDNR